MERVLAEQRLGSTTDDDDPRWTGPVRRPLRVQLAPTLCNLRGDREHKTRVPMNGDQVVSVVCPA